MIGERIRTLGKRFGESQQAMADALGISQRTVGHWEVDRNCPDAITIARIADRYETTTDYVLCRTDDPSLVRERCALTVDRLPVITDIEAHHAHNAALLTREDVVSIVNTAIEQLKKELEKRE